MTDVQAALFMFAFVMTVIPMLGVVAFISAVVHCHAEGDSDSCWFLAEINK